jgi:hypothetical protein
MRGRGGGPRPGRGGGGSGFYRRNYSRDDAEHQSTSSAPGDFNDYPTDFTTLPIYPVVPEYIMPYVTPAYYQAPFVPPPAHAVVKNTQMAPAFVPVDKEVVTEMVKKQM